VFSKKVKESVLAAVLLLLPPGPGNRDTGPQLPLDTGRIPTGRWTYRVLVSGEPAGEFTSTISREGEAIISESSLSGTFIQQGSVTAAAATLRPVRSRTFIYEPGAGSTTAQLSYRAAGDSLRVTGSVTWARPAEPRTPLDIDRSLPAGTIDNQTLDLLIASLPLELNRAWRVELFEPTTFLETFGVTIDVRERQTVRVPAGRFETWRVEVRGFSAPVTYWFDTSTRLLVAQEAAGRGLRLELLTPPSI